MEKRAAKRLKENPIIEPRSDTFFMVDGKKVHWESERTFNPGAIKIDGKVYVFYRACGDDRIDRVGLAVFEQDGKTLVERLSEPIYEMEEGEFPVSLNQATPESIKGIQDPRIVQIEDKIYMVFAAWTGEKAYIALSVITVDDFLSHRWDTWERYGCLNIDSWQQDKDDRDATLYPEKINGGYVLLHRMESAPGVKDIVLSYSQDLKEWSRAKVVLKRRSELWDRGNIGEGVQPIKTTQGWLHIYHGARFVEGTSVYKLGVYLNDLHDPEKILYRSVEPIFETEDEWDMKKVIEVYPPIDVVFPCGAVPLDKDSNEILDKDDELMIYYGAGDKVVCGCTVKLAEIMP